MTKINSGIARASLLMWAAVVMLAAEARADLARLVPEDILKQIAEETSGEAA